MELFPTIKFIEYKVPPGHSIIRVPFLFDKTSMLREVPLDLQDEQVKLLAEVLSRRDAEVKALVDRLSKIYEEMRPVLQKSGLYETLKLELRKYYPFFSKYDCDLIEKIIKSMEKEKSA